VRKPSFERAGSRLEGLLGRYVVSCVLNVSGEVEKFIYFVQNREKSDKIALLEVQV
jgi:hypothetical protein